MSGRRPSSFDKSQLVQLLNWFVFIVSVFGLCARIGTRYVTHRWTHRLDDKLILLAQAVFLFETISVSIGASHGLGKAMSSLSEEELSSTLKAEYATVPLLILAVALVKCSLATFIYQLSPDGVHHRVTTGVVVVVGVWAASSIAFSLAQCSAPAPWDYIHGQHCLDRTAWWTYVSVLNIVTELCFIVQYVLVFKSLQLPVAKRLVLMTIFSTRFLVVIAIAAHLVVFRQVSQQSDITLNSWLPVVLNQVMGSLSITTACIPYLKPFMQSLEADIIRVDSNSGEGEDARRRHYTISRGTGYSLHRYNTSSANCSANR